MIQLTQHTKLSACWRLSNPGKVVCAMAMSINFAVLLQSECQGQSVNKGKQPSHADDKSSEEAFFDPMQMVAVSSAPPGQNKECLLPRPSVASHPSQDVKLD
jgi:hypothetical protein